MAGDINRVTLVGRLTRDPELRHTQGGAAVLQMGLAVNGRVRDGDNWTDKPNYFDVKVWGQQAESLYKSLTKGRRIAVDGRLDWQTWGEGENKRTKVEVVANQVQYLDPPPQSSGGGEFSGGGGAYASQAPQGEPQPQPVGGGGFSGQPTPVDGGDFAGAAPARQPIPDDDDIPF
jgi:single-strand DNA-binding protein